MEILSNDHSKHLLHLVHFELQFQFLFWFCLELVLLSVLIHYLILLLQMYFNKLVSCIIFYLAIALFLCMCQYHNWAGKLPNLMKMLMPLMCRLPDIADSALSWLDLMSVIGGSDTSWFIWFNKLSCEVLISNSDKGQIYLFLWICVTESHPVESAHLPAVLPLATSPLIRTCMATKGS